MAIFKGMNGPRLRIINGMFRTVTEEPTKPAPPEPVVTAEQVDFNEAFPAQGLTVADRGELERIYSRVAASLDTEISGLEAEAETFRRNGRKAAFTILRPLIVNLSAIRNSRLFVAKVDT